MCDNHNHDHSHGHSPEETVALLSYMSDHNKHHGEDLHEIYHALEESGRSEAAELIHKALHLYDDGNRLLDEALKLLKDNA